MGADPTDREGPVAAAGGAGRGPGIGYTDSLCCAGRAEGLGV